MQKNNKLLIILISVFGGLALIIVGIVLCFYFGLLSYKNKALSNANQTLSQNQSSIVNGNANANSKYKEEDYLSFSSYKFVPSKEFDFSEKEKGTDFFGYYTDRQTLFYGMTEPLASANMNLDIYTASILDLYKNPEEKVEVLRQEKVTIGNLECMKLTEKSTEDYSLYTQYVYVINNKGYLFTLVYFDDTTDTIKDAEQMLSTIIFK